MNVAVCEKSGSKNALGYPVEQVVSSTIAFAGLLLPYVAFEPAPVDFLLLLSSMIFLIYGGKIPRAALLFALVYLIFYVVAGLDSLLHGRENISKFSRYYLIEFFLIFTTVMCYSIFVQFPSARYVFLRHYVIGAVVSSVLVLLIFKFVPSFHFIYRDSSLIRLDGFFKDPNVLGPYLILPALMLIFARDRIGLSVIWVVGAIPVVSLIFLTLSRAAIFCLICAMIIFIFLRGAFGVRRKNWIIAFALLALLSLSLPFLQEEIINIAEKMQGFQERMRLHSYDSDRFHDIAHSFTVGTPHLFGLGPASYQTMFESNSPHNLIMAKLVDAGWVPTFMITWFIVYPTWLVFRDYLRTRDSLLLVLFSVIAVHVVNAMVLNPHHWRHLLLICVMIFSMRKCPWHPPV